MGSDISIRTASVYAHECRSQKKPRPAIRYTQQFFVTLPTGVSKTVVGGTADAVVGSRCNYTQEGSCPRSADGRQTVVVVSKLQSFIASVVDLRWVFASVGIWKKIKVNKNKGAHCSTA